MLFKVVEQTVIRTCMLRKTRKPRHVERQSDMAVRTTAGGRGVSGKLSSACGSPASRAPLNAPSTARVAAELVDTFKSAAAAEPANRKPCVSTLHNMAAPWTMLSLLLRKSCGSS